jgi:twitching motility protein PilT
MRRRELDQLFSVMLDTHPRVSDLLITVGRPLQVEADGVLSAVMTEPAIERLTPFQTESIALNLIGESQWLLDDLINMGSCDSAYTVADKARFRVNVFSQRGSYSVVMRKLNTVIPTLEDLQMPQVFKQIPKEKTGLVLVTGATGSGKSTTLAAILNEINETRAVHMITLEDPVEFVHSHKQATINQRELGMDFDSFASGLRAALRQAPKVILVGEMRDRETVQIALSAAETGHLVFSTLHTIDAGQTINRILGMFELEEQEQIRVRLADTLRWIVSQRLAPKVNGGRWALLEIMGHNLRTWETIAKGESEGKTFHDIIEAAEPFGWRTFDRSCLDAFEEGLITEDTALLYCSKRGPVSRGVDLIKKARGEDTSSSMVSLRMKQTQEGSKAPAPPPPPVLKLK